MYYKWLWAASGARSPEIDSRHARGENAQSVRRQGSSGYSREGRRGRFAREESLSRLARAHEDHEGRPVRRDGAHEARVALGGAGLSEGAMAGDAGGGGGAVVALDHALEHAAH